MCRYIDDIIVFNVENFEELIGLIYPSDLKAEKDNTNSENLHYLDVNIAISNGTMKTSIYHKIDFFPFNVTVLTFPDNCIPIRLGPNVFYGQVLRFGRICSELIDFLYRTKKIVMILVSRGYNIKDLKYTFNKCMHENRFILQKYNLFGSLNMVRTLFNTKA